MKKILAFLLVFVSMCSFFSCQKAPINGDLDGQWEVTDVIVDGDNLKDETRRFYNFYLHVCMLSYYGGTFTFANMVYDGETLSLDFPSPSEDETQALRNFGITTNPITFAVDFSDRHHLTLYNDKSTVVLIKH